MPKLVRLNSTTVAEIAFLGEGYEILFVQHTTYNGKPALLVRAQCRNEITDFYAEGRNDEARS